MNQEKNVKRTIIVTGANSGIGLEVVKRLCELGHEVVITVRDAEKGDLTLSKIRSVCPEANIRYFTMDLSNFASVRKFVDDFHSTGKQLDILINNAGMFPPYTGKERWSLADNSKFELTMTTNCLGTFLLTNLLLEDLKASAKSRTDGTPSRIVNVSSSITLRYQEKTQFTFEDFMLEAKGSYEGMRAYRNSKIALNLWSNELAKMLSDTGVIVNTLCPGFIPATDLGRHSDGVLYSIFRFIMTSFIVRALSSKIKTLEYGRDRVIEMALNDATAKTTGKFYNEGSVAEECPEVRNVDNQLRIWDVCVKHTGL